ncbi:TIGR02679 family protein [Streptomyces sedi]|uniref:TIGR02679 family protein n=1 Tax=Streptomyces sedi TaxID=555059 RepID=A0A5C4VBB0_9ACTN|nr:TIGR02679 family protein [Streptomyces sedi]TNM32776.1 TIGR02679 family protein [Streptomyces sedi]
MTEPTGRGPSEEGGRRAADPRRGETAGRPRAGESAGVDEARLRRLLGDPELAWLVRRARHRMAGGKPLTGTVTLTAPTDPQRRAVESLLGRGPSVGGSLSVRLEDVDAVLRRSGVSAEGLGGAVVALTGPVYPLGARRAEEARAWEEALSPLQLLDAGLAEWAARMREEGRIRRLARTPRGARSLVESAVVALGALPAVPAVPVSAFAARVLGDAHALDDGRPLATLVLSGARALAGLEEERGAGPQREAWAAVGLLKDDVSSTVLTLNLRGTPALDWMADRGEPAVLTLRQLARHPTAPGAAGRPAGEARVHVCENPAVLVAGAGAYGAECPPMVCVQGQPSTAALTLLRRMCDRGAFLRYHGDFDWGGLRIASTLLRSVPWEPWRFTASHYRAAVAAGASSLGLTGTPTDAPWDPPLAVALDELGVRVEEEAVLGDLLSDLKPAG